MLSAVYKKSLKSICKNQPIPSSWRHIHSLAESKQCCEMGHRENQDPGKVRQIQFPAWLLPPLSHRSFWMQISICVVARVLPENKLGHNSNFNPTISLKFTLLIQWLEAQ